MGSFITLNDTLRINKGQGFPSELDIEKHLSDPFSSKDFKGREFEFDQKEQIRVYQQPPLRNFLVEEVDGKWIPWGTCIITEIRHDYKNKVTSGRFEILDIYPPDQLKVAMKMIHPTASAEGYLDDRR